MLWFYLEITPDFHLQEPFLPSPETHMPSGHLQSPLSNSCVFPSHSCGYICRCAELNILTSLPMSYIIHTLIFTLLRTSHFQKFHIQASKELLKVPSQELATITFLTNSKNKLLFLCDINTEHLL